MFRNATAAFRGLLEEILRDGAPVESRTQSTRELLAVSFTLERPRERCIVDSERHNNVFASIAETLWVLSGRDDLDYLSAYLPRALDFSDDGKTWRGAYGPRMRSWLGVDQVAAVVELLREHPTSRRAVISLFDPARDFEPSTDIPCNNWLQFVLRDGRLDMHVVARSMDIMWGFSGINSFEWSVLHDLIASSLGAEVGNQVYFVGSLHLYDRHLGRAETISATPSQNAYSNAQTMSRVTASLDEFDEQLRQTLRWERSLRAGNLDDDWRPEDQLLRQFSIMLLIYWTWRHTLDIERTESVIKQLDDDGLVAAAHDYLHWIRPPEH